MSNMSKKYITTMPDGSKWAIPVTLIADDRSISYAGGFDGDVLRSTTEDTSVLFDSDAYEIEDWAQNNMNWDDVKDHAECISRPECDYQEGWVNGEHEVL